MLTERSITIMNQFTNTSYSSQGATPANFVEDYMARNDATLTTYPVEQSDFLSTNVTDPQSVYQNQKDILLNRRKNYDPKRPNAQDWFDLTTLEGRSFSQDGISLSKNLIHEEAKRMQEAFQKGHTVLKLVASFDNDYLKDLNVEKEKALNFHTDVDEMKLRLAVKKGCKALSDSLGYTKPLYIGSIQLDRDHPHAHIAMCETAPREKSRAKFFYDGHEWGQLSKADRNNMRQAINNDLEINQAINFFPSNQVEEGQHMAETFSKKFANLGMQKRMILAQSLNQSTEKTPHEVSLEEQLIQDLSMDLSHKTHHNRQKIRTRIRKKVHIQNKKGLVKLPALINMQLQSMFNLEHSNKRTAKMIRKLKKAHEKERKAKERENMLANQYRELKRLAISHPDKSYLINSQILPFYQQALIDTATTIDFNRQYQYQPVNDIPISVQNDYQDLKNSLKTSDTQFAKEEAKDRLLNQTIYWHQRGYIDGKSVSTIIMQDVKNIETNNRVPEKPKNFIGNHKKILPLTEKEKQRELNFENQAYQALNEIDDTPQTNSIKQNLREDIENNHQIFTKNGQNLNAERSIVRSSSIQETNNQSNQSAQTLQQKAAIKQYSALSYQEADNMLFDSVN